jgi:uncharacterized protein (DUF4415 family)
MSDEKPWLDPDFDDNPEWTEADFARARPASEIMPPEVMALLVRQRGRPALPAGERKEQVNLRLSPDVVNALRETGPGWQGRADEALRKAFVKR